MTQKANATSRPNILMIVSDDQGAWAMAHAGTPELHTPTLDRLARWGKRFASLYCVSPVCSPARASLLTGRIPSAHGIHDWLREGNAKSERDYHGELIDYMDRYPTLAERLAGAGYRCGMSGKWHLGNSHAPHRGYAFWKPFATGGGAYRDPAMIAAGEIVHQPGYVTDIITDNALAFLDGTETGQPWYLGLHYTAPHAPWTLDQHPPEDVARYYPGCAFESLPDVPMHPDFYDPARFPANDDQRRRILSGYAAALTAMDRAIGRVLDRLEALRMLDDTLIVFTSDNGMNMSHHGIYGKGNGTVPINLLETSVKVPGIVVHRGTIPPGVLTGIYSHYDILPTLMARVGLPEPLPGTLPGRDISGVLTVKAPEEDRFAIVFDEYGSQRMIRRGDWKYVARPDDTDCELYALHRDPTERENLNGDPAFAATKADLQGTLVDWFAEHAVLAYDGYGLPVIGGGQIDHLVEPSSDRPPFVDHAGAPCVE